MIDLQAVLIAIGLIALGCAIIVCAACRLSAQMDARRRRWEVMHGYSASTYEHDRQQQRVRMHSVAGEDGPSSYHESGNAEADLVAFLGLVVAIGVVWAGLWSLSGW